MLTIVGALLLIAAGFLGGVFWTRSQSQSGLFYGLPVATENTQSRDTASELAQRIEEVTIILSDRSYMAPDVDTATSAAVTAMLQSSGDPYARYFNEDQYGSYIDATSSTSSGGSIGIILSEYKGSAYVTYVYPGSAAEAAGMREGDFIVSIDDVTKSSWTIEEATTLIATAGDEGVGIGWRHPDSLSAPGGEAGSATLVATDLDTGNVTSYLDDQQIGYVRILQFAPGVSDEVRSALADLEQQGAVGYVLDLRCNPGGYVEQAVSVASCFISTGTIVGIEDNSGSVDYRIATHSTVTDKPLSVLVNEDSASMAEVCAAALKDTGRATIVGTTTQGKGTIQAFQELSFGGAIKYTVSNCLTPTGAEIEGSGVSPDIEVAMDPGRIGTDEDIQLQTARQSVLAQTASAQVAETDASDRTAATSGGEEVDGQEGA